MRRHRQFVLLLVVVLATVGCASQDPGGDDGTRLAASAARDGLPDAPTAAETATAPSTPPGAADVEEVDGDPPPANAAALQFTARRLGGGTVTGTDYAGGDVVLWMWAPWCPQCNREAPHVRDAVARYGDEVTFIGVPGQDDDEAHAAFVAQHGLEGLVHAIDDDGSLWARYGVSYQPAWVFIDEDGSAQLHAGGLYGDLDARIEDLITS